MIYVVFESKYGRSKQYKDAIFIDISFKPREVVITLQNERRLEFSFDRIFSERGDDAYTLHFINDHLSRKATQDLIKG